ncbi:MAG: TolC family protein [Saprospiraceae bacterium]
MLSKSGVFSFYLVAIIFIFNTTDVYSQKQWTLLECINMAVDNNLQMVAMENNIDNGVINLKQSIHSQFPGLQGGINLGNNFGRTVDPTSNSFITQSILSNGFSLNSSMVLFNGFSIRNTIDQAKLNNTALYKDREQLKRDIVLNVSTAYLNVLFAKENISIAENQLEQTINQRDFVLRMIQVGNSAENAIFDVDAQIAQNEQNLVTAKNSLELGKLTLRQAMRLDPSIPFDITTPSVTINTDMLDILTMDELTKSAFQNQVGLEASRLRIAVAEKGEKIAQAGFYPSLGIGGSLSSNFSNRFNQIKRFDEIILEQDIIFNGQEVTIGFPQSVPVFESIPYFDQLNNNLSYGFGLSLNIPIYSNNNIKAAKGRAEIATKTAANNYEIAKDNLKVTVTQSYTEAKAAKARFDASEKTFKAQQAVYDNAIKRFESGAINSFELVRVKSVFETAQTNFLIARYDLYFRLKVLDFYMGKPLNIE